MIITTSKTEKHYIACKFNIFLHDINCLVKIWCISNSGYFVNAVCIPHTLCYGRFEPLLTRWYGDTINIEVFVDWYIINNANLRVLARDVLGEGCPCLGPGTSTRTTRSPVAFKAATASSCVTLSKFTSPCCNKNMSQFIFVTPSCLYRRRRRRVGNVTTKVGVTAHC